MMQWWLDRWTYVKAHPTAVIFCDTYPDYRPRLTISWEQFYNFNNVITLLRLRHCRQQRHWDLSHGLWLHFRRSGSVRLTKSYPHHQQLYFHFTTTIWRVYINRIRPAILHYHRHQHGQSRRQLQQSAFHPIRQRHVRRRSRRTNHPYRRLSSPDDSRLQVQTLSGPAPDVTRLPSIISPQYSNVCQRQDTSVGSTFSFRRALYDHLSVHPSTSTTTDNTNNDDLAEFCNQCTIE